MRMQAYLNSWGPIFYRRRMLIRQPRKPNLELPPEVEGDGQSFLCCLVVLDRSVSWLDFPRDGANVLGRPATLFSGDISGRGRFHSVAHFLASNTARHLPVQPSRNPNSSDFF
jgi:hypothetical protein